MVIRMDSLIRFGIDIGIGDADGERGDLVESSSGHERVFIRGLQMCERGRLF